MIAPRRILLAAPALLLARGARADVQIGGGLTQGGFVNGRATPGTRLALEGRAVRVSRDGAFAFGFGRDHGPTASLAITHPGGRQETRTLDIQRRQWRIERVQGLPTPQVDLDEATLARWRAERERLQAVRSVDSDLTGFAAGFIRPAHGRNSGFYGSQRILNGQPRSPHYGLDFAVPVGTPIAAAADGRITLSAEFALFGNIIVVDHGHGVNTLYAHLSVFNVREGEMVRTGQQIAASGATGRVSGPHLHFSLSWYQVWVDPNPVLPPA